MFSQSFKLLPFKSLAVIFATTMLTGGCHSTTTLPSKEAGEEIAMQQEAVGSSRPLIIEIVSRDSRIAVRSSGGGVTYSLLNPHGENLTADMTLLQFQAYHPELARRVSTMNASAGMPTAWAGVE